MRIGYIYKRCKRIHNSCTHKLSPQRSFETQSALATASDKEKKNTNLTEEPCSENKRTEISIIIQYLDFVSSEFFATHRLLNASIPLIISHDSIVHIAPSRWYQSLLCVIFFSGQNELLATPYYRLRCLIAIRNHVLVCILFLSVYRISCFNQTHMCTAHKTISITISFIFFLFSRVERIFFSLAPCRRCYLSICTKPCANRQHNGQIEKTATREEVSVR